MLKRVSLLSGFAILAVVCSHASEWGDIAMWWWADRWRPVSVPNYDMDASLPYYMLVAERKLAHFSVPAFMFFSAFFLSYAASGKTSGVNWRTVKARVQALLVPYLIWYAVSYAKGLLEGSSYPLWQLPTRLLLGWPAGAFWYLPVICFFYLLSPFLVPLALEKPRALIIVAGVVHFALIAYEYVRVGEALKGITLPVWESLVPRHFLLALFFVLGLVVGIHRKEFALRLAGHAWHLCFVAVAMGLLAVCESELIWRSIEDWDWSTSNATLPTTLYALAVILLFLSVQELPKSMSAVLQDLGSEVLGIYFLHGFLLELTARATQKYAPGILGFPMLFQVVLVSAGVAGSMLIMKAARRPPVRRYYRYLFG